MQVERQAHTVSKHSKGGERSARVSWPRVKAKNASPVREHVCCFFALNKRTLVTTLIGQVVLSGMKGLTYVSTCIATFYVEKKISKFG